MARIKLEMPAHYIFSTTIDIRISDINYGNHLGNDAVLSLLHEARVRFLAQHGFSELDIEGCGFFITDAVIVYKGEGFYGDTLTIEIALDDWDESGVDMLYRVSNQATSRELVDAKTRLTFIDPVRRKIAPIPEGFRQLFDADADKKTAL